MMAKNLLLKDCDAERARSLIAEIGKVRCWLTGFEDGRGRPNNIPGEDSLRQIPIILQQSVSSTGRN